MLALSDDVKLLVIVEHVRPFVLPLCKTYGVVTVPGMFCSTLQPFAYAAELLADLALEHEFTSCEAAVFQVICGGAIPACSSVPHTSHS